MAQVMKVYVWETHAPAGDAPCPLHVARPQLTAIKSREKGRGRQHCTPACKVLGERVNSWLWQVHGAPAAHLRFRNDGTVFAALGQLSFDAQCSGVEVDVFTPQSECLTQTRMGPKRDGYERTEVFRHRGRQGVDVLEVQERSFWAGGLPGSGDAAGVAV